MTLGDADLESLHMKVIYRKFPKQRHYLSPRFRSSDSAILTSMMTKQNDNVRLNAKSVRFTQPRQRLMLGPRSLTKSPKQPTIFGYKDTANGSEWMPKKETLMCIAKC